MVNVIVEANTIRLVCDTDSEEAQCRAIEIIVASAWNRNTSAVAEAIRALFGNHGTPKPDDFADFMRSIGAEE